MTAPEGLSGSRGLPGEDGARELAAEGGSEGIPAEGYRVPDVPEVPELPAGREEPSAAADLTLRVLGGLLVLAGGFVVAILAVLLVPLRLADFGPVARGLGAEAGTGLGAVPIPLALVVAIAGNLVLLWLARQVTGARWGGLLPCVGWFVLVVMAIRTTSEGDRLLVSDDWVATLTLFGGTVVLVIGAVLGLSPARQARGRYGPPPGRYDPAPRPPR